MEANKPILTFKNFTGIGDSGLYWLDGFLPKMIQGQSILTQGWGCTSFIDPTVSGYANLTNGDQKLISMASYQHVTNNQIAALHALGYIFDFQSSGLNKIGQIHFMASNGATPYCQGGAIFATRLGNLLYSTSNHLGVGYVSRATGGSASTLVDTAKNFTNLGVTSSAGANKVYNLTKGFELTVGSLTGTDTLNVSGGTTSAGDWYIAFVDTKFSFGTTNVVNIQFNPQPDPKYWNRQVFLWNDTYYTLNGNYISALATDESTWTSDILEEAHKQLPTNHQALMAEFNQDRLLVVSYIQGKGSLLLWDGYSPNWLNDLRIETPASAITRYGTGWVVLIGANLYYTDGYSLTYLNKLPDSILTDGQVPHIFNMVYTEDGLILSFAGNTTTRLVSGCFIYNVKEAVWSYCPLKDKNGAMSQTNPNLFVVNRYDTTFVRGTPVVFASWSEIGKITNRGAKKSSVLLYAKLPQKMAITEIELNIAPRNDWTIGAVTQSNRVRVNYGDGRNAMYTTIVAATGSTVTTIKNAVGNAMKTRVGQELFVLTGPVGYERTFIESIADGGTVNEVLTVSPALSAAPSTTTPIRVLNLKSAGGLKTLASDDLPTDLMFGVPEFFSDNLWIEVVFEDQDDFPLDLLSVNVYG